MKVLPPPLLEQKARNGGVRKFIDPPVDHSWARRSYSNGALLGLTDTGLTSAELSEASELPRDTDFIVDVVRRRSATVP